MLINDSRNIKDAGGVITLADHNIHLKFYTKKVILFKVGDKQKRLVVIVFNQSFQPSSSFESVIDGGISSILPSWESVFSLRGLSFLCFMALLGLMFMNNSMCKDVNKALASRASLIKGLANEPSSAEVPDGVHPYDYAEGETKDIRNEYTAEATEGPIVLDGSWREAFCTN